MRRASQPTRNKAPLDITFVAELRKSPSKGGWHYLVWPQSAEVFGTRGLVRVRGTICGRPFQSAFMAMGGGVHKLPVKAEMVRALGKKTGDLITVRLQERVH